MTACGGQPLAAAVALLLAGCAASRAPGPDLDLDPAVREAAQRSCASTERIDPSARPARLEHAHGLAATGNSAAPADWG